MEDVTTLLTHDRIKNYFIGGFMASIEQKFAQIISNLSKKKTSLYIGDLAWSLGRERFISDLENQNEIDRLKLVDEYISNKHYLINSNSEGVSKYYNSLKKNQTFEYIFIDIFHRQQSYFHDSKRIDGFEIEHLDLISDKGFALVVANEDEFSDSKMKDLLHDKGYYLNAVFGLPLVNTRHKRLLKDQSIFYISRQKTSNLFVADLSKDLPGSLDWKKIVENFFLKLNGGSSLRHGISIKNENFYTFNTLRAIERIKELSSHYDEYKEGDLGDVLISIEESIDVIEFLEEARNGIFIIKNMRSYGDLLPVTTDKEYVNIQGPWSYYYVELNKKVDAEYVVIFLQSHIGRALMLGITNIVNKSNKLDKVSIKEIPIFFPLINVQKKIIRTHKKVVDLQESIDKFRNNLSLNPSQFINESVDKIDDMLDQVGKLNKTDKVRQIIERGENSTIEFKRTFGLETNPNDPEYEKSREILKIRIFEQMSAFLNSYGGTLLIGVHDEEYVTGMEKELQMFYGKSHDKFKLRFNEQINKHLGKGFTSSDYITYDFVPIDNHEVFQIDCNRSPIPCRFGKEERLIVQEDPRIRTLKGEDEMKYISKHFPGYFASHLT